jgi:CheY-like chemotaxis protein
LAQLLLKRESGTLSEIRTLGPRTGDNGRLSITRDLVKPRDRIPCEECTKKRREIALKILAIGLDTRKNEDIQRIAETRDHTVKTVKLGNDALEAALSASYEIFLVNLSLPDMEGVQFIRQLKRLRANPRILAFTSLNSRELELEVRKEGVIYYMIEPGERSNLGTIIDHLSKQVDSGTDLLTVANEIGKIPTQ